MERGTELSTRLVLWLHVADQDNEDTRLFGLRHLTAELCLQLVCDRVRLRV